MYVLDYIEDLGSGNSGSSIGSKAAAGQVDAETWEDAVAHFDKVWISSLTFAVLGSLLYLPDLWGYCERRALILVGFPSLAQQSSERHPLPWAALLLTLAFQAKFGVPLKTRAFLCSQRWKSCGCHR